MQLKYKNRLHNLNDYGEFSARTINRLRNLAEFEDCKELYKNGVFNVDYYINNSCDAMLLAQPNFGRKSLNEIKAVVKSLVFGVTEYKPKTLRDEFAIAALTGICANKIFSFEPEEKAKISYIYADAMLKAREAKQ